jgi:hypothetical protein
MTHLEMNDNQPPYQIADDKTNISGNSTNSIKVGNICPDCHLGILDYDGMLNLVCPTCGYTAGGCFT